MVRREKGEGGRRGKGDGMKREGGGREGNVEEGHGRTMYAA